MAETGLGLARAGLFPPYHLHVTALPAEERDLPGIGNRLKQKGFDYLQVILVTPAGDWSIAMANLKFTGIQVIFVAPAVDRARAMSDLKILLSTGLSTSSLRQHPLLIGTEQWQI